ncbi:MAG TPA: DALR domain-containing protein, partial [Bacteroidota bacterium]|nr:DALR domain-containing protein [Bacteroidota bacterium]
FPHHECEIAQSEGATGKPFVKYWLHNNMVTVNGQKMGKSLGNFTTLKDAFKKWRPEVIRFFILQSHYRSTLDFSNEAIEGAAKGLQRLANTMSILKEKRRATGAGGKHIPTDLAKYKADFLAAMDDDLNTPQAIAVLFDLSRDVNQHLASIEAFAGGGLQGIEGLFKELAEGILGMTLSDTDAGSSNASLESGLMDLIIALRQEIRAQKLWPLSDKIRDGLAGLGIALEDRKEGTTWKRTL